MLGRMRAEPGRDHNRTHTGLEGHLLAQIKELSKQLDQERGLSPADLEWEEPTQRVIVVAGVPLGTPGATNMLRIAYVGPNDADV